ncbi:S1 family peptidase [Streptomyces sp. NPDC057638]|uniref:S1 family peptidase n=1 Tax=Streptomyces sp. NPDC057638 TaxID=3346190 RepID=UPI00369FC989
MSQRRIPTRKLALAGAGALGLATAAVLLPQAYGGQGGQEDPPAAQPRTLTPAAAARLAKEIGPGLGDAYGGAYYDAERRRLVVNIADGDRSAWRRVERAGAVGREVRHSAKALLAARGSLAGRATVPGTAWALDPRDNQVLVTADRTVTGKRWDRLEAAVEALGSGMARIEKSSGQFKPFALEGGDAIFSGTGGGRCSLGFNVTTAEGAPGFLTAGHCATSGDRFSGRPGETPLGTLRAGVFPGDGDFALVTYDDPATRPLSAVDLGDGQGVRITQVADAAVGQEVFRMGSTTGLDGGRVTGLDATVNYPEGSVSGLIQTDVCAEPGDSGGAMFTRDGSAIGLTSGGSGDCASGGETFFQPVATALAAVNARLG